MKTILPYTILILFLFACSKNHAPEEEKSDHEDNTIALSDAQLKAIDIVTQKIQRRMMPLSISVSGKLDVPPQNLVTISAPMGGFVKATTLLQGIKVKKGDALVTLENQDYIQLQQDYLENKSKLEFFEAEFVRQSELSKENVNSSKTFQQAKTQYQSAKATVAGLEARLSMINIPSASVAEGRIRSTITLYAPISGFVTTVNVNIGQFVNATDAMFNIVNLDHIHAELQIFERDISKIKTGQKVHVKLINEAQHRDASVYLIGREISADRTVRVHCHFTNEDDDLLPGMFVNADIEIESFDADVVPEEAVVTFEGTSYVFVQATLQRYFPLEVKVEKTVAGYSAVQFVEPFDDQMEIVTRGAPTLMALLKNEPEE